MAVVGNTFLNLADKFRAMGDDSGRVEVIEMLAQNNPMIMDAYVRECNRGYTHQTTIRTGLPKPAWRMMYKGTQPSKGTTAQVIDSTGFVESWAEQDAKEIDDDPQGDQLRMLDGEAHVQGMGNEVEELCWYGSEDVTPERFTGLSPRFSSLTAGTGSQIIDAGGTGSDNTSIWLVSWGEPCLKLLYPKGTRAGLQREDKGKSTKELANNEVYDVYREKFCWDVGMSLADYRGIARIANIDVSQLGQTGGAEVYKNLISAVYRVRQPGMQMCRKVIYANQTVLEHLDQQARVEENVRLRIKEVQGEEVVHFRGIPIHRADSILETEARIT